MLLRGASFRLFAASLPAFVACGEDLATTGAASDGSTSMASESGFSTTGGAPTTGEPEPEILRGISAVQHNADGSRIVYHGGTGSKHDRYYFVDLASPEPASVDLSDWFPPDEPLWAGLSPSGRQFFVELGGPFDDFTGVFMIPLEPVGDGVMVSEPGEGGHYFRLLPPN